VTRANDPDSHPTNLALAEPAHRPIRHTSFSRGATGHPLPMSANEKFEGKKDEVKGKVKESAGHATDNPKLETEGTADKIKGDLKQAFEKVKDAFKK
jgi:uncharacterized protein YjbJ (UPF0337 family)